MVDVARARKLAVRIREIVAATLETQVKDPRLGMVTITDAKVTPDLREATIYYTVYGDDVARQESAMALESAKGVLRSTVGKQTGVRYTPSLAFVADAVPETAGRIEDLLAQARAEDARVQELASAAAHAGEADPYRAARVLEEDDEELDTGATEGPGA
jgi:ribosome-binding factor A